MEGRTVGTNEGAQVGVSEGIAVGCMVGYRHREAPSEEDWPAGHGLQPADPC